MRIEGEMQVGEASRYAGRASGRLSGHPGPMIVANVVAALATIVPIVLFGIWRSMVDAPAWLWAPAVLVAMAFGLWAGPAACRGYTVGVFRRNLAERGLPSQFHSRFEITDEAFVNSTGRMKMSAEWAAVSDIVQTGPYWILLAEGHPQFLPRRYFASPVEEKAFLSAMLSRMTPEARRRSGEAVKFAAGQA